MVINEKEYPQVLQAYETSAGYDQFVAEQVVHNQMEAENFATRCSGLLIKATSLLMNDGTRRRPKEKAIGKPSSSSAIWIILVLLMISLIVAGFTTGWVQRTFHWPVN